MSNKVSIVTEEICKKIITTQVAFDAVENAFKNMASKKAINFPVTRDLLGYKNAIYGCKSGFDINKHTLGLKSGGYWPNNIEKGLTNHQSTVFLFNPNNGKLSSIVAGNHLTSMRTAAASAISIYYLARKNSKTLGIVGAGHQAKYQLEAALEQHNFEKVIAWNGDKTKLINLEAICKKYNVTFQSSELEFLCNNSDVIITITSSNKALIKFGWIKPGTHLSCMGTDTKNKQEIDEHYFSNAKVFTDELEQCISIGEAQHAFKKNIINVDSITKLGSVISNENCGRVDDQEITIFDGTGVGIQDLAVASLSVEIAKKLNDINFIEI